MLNVLRWIFSIIGLLAVILLAIIFNFTPQKKQVEISTTESAPQPQENPAIPAVQQSVSNYYQNTNETIYNSLVMPSEDGVIKLSADDLGVQTHKWDGNIVEVVANCFYADVNEYRCIAGRGRVDFSTIMPDDLAEDLKQKCDTISKMNNASCRKTIRFYYTGFSEADIGGLMGKITVVSAKDNFGALMRNRASGRKKR